MGPQPTTAHHSPPQSTTSHDALVMASTKRDVTKGNKIGLAAESGCQHGSKPLNQRNVKAGRFETTTTSKYIGRLKGFRSDRGFGFIKCPDFTHDVFAHASTFLKAVPEHRSSSSDEAAMGEEVEFSIDRRNRANHVRIVGDALQDKDSTVVSCSHPDLAPSSLQMQPAKKDAQWMQQEMICPHNSSEESVTRNGFAPPCSRDASIVAARE